MKKRFILIMLMLILLCGCQSNPKENAVTSKNDGTFDISAVRSSDEKKDNSPQFISRTEQFYSTDGTVEFRLALSEDIVDKEVPVLLVEPYYLTANDAERVAKALFGDVTFYEAEPLLNEVLTQNDIQLKIQRWSKYANESALIDLYGSGQSVQDDVELIKRFIDKYTQLFEYAPGTDLSEVCQWQFKEESYYRVSTDRIAGRDLENDNDSIVAAIHKDDVYYRFDASTRNKSDFKLNNITAYLYDGISPADLDGRIFRANLCRTQAPTEDQIMDVKDKAKLALEEMDLGDWLIDECYIDTEYYGDTPEYTIKIKAVPVLNGIPAIRFPQLTFSSGNDLYSANYYLTDVSFEYSSDGKLVSFEMYSPITIKDTINSNVEVMNIESLLDRAIRHLELSDYYEYGLDSTLDSVADKLGCLVTISEMAYNLIRVQASDTESGYYYIPGIVLYGNVEYFDKENGESYFSSEHQMLVAMNGLDGSIIEIDG